MQHTGEGSTVFFHDGSNLCGLKTQIKIPHEEQDSGLNGLKIRSRMESLVNPPFLSFFIELLQLFNHTNKKTNLSSSIYISEVKNYLQVNQESCVSCFKKKKEVWGNQTSASKKPQHMPSNILFNTYHFIAAPFPPPHKIFPRLPL